MLTYTDACLTYAHRYLTKAMTLDIDGMLADLSGIKTYADVCVC
jgi:hypothetical protein